MVHHFNSVVLLVINHFGKILRVNHEILRVFISELPYGAADQMLEKYNH